MRQCSPWPAKMVCSLCPDAWRGSRLSCRCRSHVRSGAPAGATQNAMPKTPSDRPVLRGSWTSHATTPPVWPLGVAPPGSSAQEEQAMIGLTTQQRRDRRQASEASPASQQCVAEAARAPLSEKVGRRGESEATRRPQSSPSGTLIRKSG